MTLVLYPNDFVLVGVEGTILLVRAYAFPLAMRFGADQGPPEQAFIIESSDLPIIQDDVIYFVSLQDISGFRIIFRLWLLTIAKNK